MCTAINDNRYGHLFGRTLDLEYSYNERVVISPRNFKFNFINEKASESGTAIIGMAHIEDGMPLYYDAINEFGLGIATLNFPHFCHYFKHNEKHYNIASFEVIPWILRHCKSVSEAIELLKEAAVTNDCFNSLQTTPLHWLIGDKKSAVTFEPTAEGIKIYSNPFGVLTNSPEFSYHCLNLANYMHISEDSQPNLIYPDTDILQYSRGMGGIGLPGDFSSASRFVKAVYTKNKTLSSNEKLGNISRFFHIMNTVSQPYGCVKAENGLPVSSIYTSCADTENGIYYFTTYNCRRIRGVSMFEKEINGNELISFDIAGGEDILIM